MNRSPVTGIIPFTLFGALNKAAGSTFLRAEQLAANSPRFEIWKHGRNYDSLIFQKAYWTEMMEIFEGPKILDLCDTDWSNGSFDIMTTGNLVDAITCSSPELTNLLQSYFPSKLVEHVPDRIDLKQLPSPRPHHTGKAQHALWFGFIPNAYETLGQLAGTLRSCGLSLTILADQPYQMNDEIAELRPRFIKYDMQTAYRQIQEADVVLNPRSEKGNFRYKSNNKTIISLALGVPVAHTSGDVERLMDEFNRNNDVTKHAQIIRQEYGIERSVHQYLRILQNIG
jgi:hypothetical protein